MRQSGVLMHITSLPGAYGVGTMGASAHKFVDFLKEAGQSCWQILPLTPTGFGDSPYQSCSAFAGNPYLIDLELLEEQSLLLPEELAALPAVTNTEKVDFGTLYNTRLPLLRLAFDRFEAGEDFEVFCAQNADWLGDFSLYMALKEENDGIPWYRWEAPLKLRDPNAVWAARQRLSDQIRFHNFVQYLFHSQWEELRKYAHTNGISIIGDVPIYVPLDSVDVWSNPELFQLDPDGNPEAVAGCPPDGFSEDGQLWGNPLYRWDRMKQDGYDWWLRRLKAAGKWYDTVRLDHFRGFESYWSIPYGDTTAKNGHWEKGPGLDFLNIVKKELPNLQLIAEDLGFLTPEVLQMQDASGFPGMKVLQFAFDSREPSLYLPHNCVPNSVCYTGTHDNMTTRQWFDSAAEDAVAYATEYLNLNPQEGPVWGMIRAAFASVSELCVIPIQDFLELGEEARMNYPGKLSDSNWTWRAKDGIINRILADRIHGLTQLYQRLGTQNRKINSGETSA